MMIRCSRCGTELPPHAHFCGKCGQVQSQTDPLNAQAQINDPHLLASVHHGQPESSPGMADDRQSPEASVAPVAVQTIVKQGPDTAARPSVARAAFVSSAGRSPAVVKGPIAPVRPPTSAGRKGKTRKKTKRWGPALLVLLALLMVGGGTLTYMLLHPRPQLSLRSNYSAKKLPAAAAGTTLHLSGREFAQNSPITLLLDGKPIAGGSPLRSDRNGKLSVDLPVTATWPTGKHLLSARDGESNTSQDNLPIEIVRPGESHTPGPGGAPPDDSSFVLNITIQGRYSEDNRPLKGSEAFAITGRPDPAGGSVCKPSNHGKTVHTSTITTNNIPLTQTMTTSCQGLYKNGTLSYTQTLVSDVVVLNDNGTKITCRLNKPGPEERLSGTYTGKGEFRGTLSYISVPSSAFSCDSNLSDTFQFGLYGGSGTWTGSAKM